jgi:hypothetical protein
LHHLLIYLVQWGKRQLLDWKSRLPSFPGGVIGTRYGVSRKTLGPIFQFQTGR